MVKSRYVPVGGCQENPGCFDRGDGSLVFVSERADGVRRHCVQYYARGRGRDYKYYSFRGVGEFRSAAEALASAR